MCVIHISRSGLNHTKKYTWLSNRYVWSAGQGSKYRVPEEHLQSSNESIRSNESIKIKTRDYYRRKVTKTEMAVAEKDTTSRSPLYRVLVNNNRLVAHTHMYGTQKRSIRSRGFSISPADGGRPMPPLRRPGRNDLAFAPNP